MKSSGSVQVREESVTIPTYPVPPADLNPMFLEKRVYQGSSGKVYPNPFTDRVSNEKREQTYRAIFLENEYLKLMILPEIGGRIHVGVDKTNQYEFFYHQHVIKPALVGLLGPWISGGVEFNWPQHHRPSTFKPVDRWIEERPEGSTTVWLSEHEPMNRMKGMVGITLYPGKALIEARVRLYNCTPIAQTFLWWANVAVHANDQYEVIFPPDVTYVADHAKRATSEFPVAKGSYYGVDYSKGVDIRWYKNIPVPTSYMVVNSRYDFFGGYDHARQAGLLHVANHHFAPGKKVWTWGNAEFGYAWDRELTDSDGPYIELMAGVYTDNQPDFSWLAPYETKTFRQYWYPIHQIGPPKNANPYAALNLERNGRQVKLGICVTEAFPESRVLLTVGKKVFYENVGDLTPGAPWVEILEFPTNHPGCELTLTVQTRKGRELIRHSLENPARKPLPGSATEPPSPQQTRTNEELYLTGLHLEQYRHATRRPDIYWREALRRDPGDVRSHTALGRIDLSRGEFKKAEEHFRRAIQRLTGWNPNPYDGEPYYLLGLALKFQGRFEEARKAFHKAVWNYAFQSAGYYALAEIDCLHQDFTAALDHLEQSLLTNSQNLKARNLKAAALRRLNRNDEAEALARETISIDPLDFWSRNELLLVCRAKPDLEESESIVQKLSSLMRGQAQTYLDVAFDYANGGLLREACHLLERLRAESGSATVSSPMVLYALGYFSHRTDNVSQARTLYRSASEVSPDYCFPSRLEEMLVLEDALSVDPGNAKAFYYLGNLLYDKKRYEEAIRNWEQSCELDPNFSIPWRNLGIAYYNFRHDAAKAMAAYIRAFEVNPHDARLLYEMDQLSKRIGAPTEQRLKTFEQYPDLMNQRDDLVIEYVTLLNETGQPQKALEILLSRRFHPWEGGEGLVSAQYVWAHIILGRDLLDAGRPAEALTHFLAARHYPENFGEGKHPLTPEHHLHYLEGLSQEAMGNAEAAMAAFGRVAEAPYAFSAMTYYQALALVKLGERQKGIEKLQQLLAFAVKRKQAEAGIDYFATSLPNFLLFEDDLEKRNRVDGCFLMGLAHLGLEEINEAERAFREVISLDPDHLGAQQELRRSSLRVRAR